MFPTLHQQGLGSLSTTQLAPLGTTIVGGTDNARKTYRYVAFPVSTAFTAGTLLVAAAAPTNSTGLALSSANTLQQLSSGSRFVQVVNGATAVTAGQFTDGMLELLGANGIGQAYRIAGNSAAAAAGTITVELLEPLRNAVALVVGTNTVNLRVSAYMFPVASTTQSLPVGVTVLAVPSSTSVQYGLVQTGGPAYVNATSGTIGQDCTQDIATNAGNVANSGAATTTSIGVFASTAASSLASVYLSINAV